MNNAIDKRLKILEEHYKIGQTPATWRYPGQSPITRWKAARAAGLELDMSTGDPVTIDELARRDPEWAATLQDRRAQFEEIASILEASDGD